MTERAALFVAVMRGDGVTKNKINHQALHFPPFDIEDEDLPEFQECVAEILHRA
jgi:hypothetical protein